MGGVLCTFHFSFPRTVNGICFESHKSPLPQRKLQCGRDAAQQTEIVGLFSWPSFSLLILISLPLYTTNVHFTLNHSLLSRPLMAYNNHNNPTERAKDLKPHNTPRVPGELISFLKQSGTQAHPFMGKAQGIRDHPQCSILSISLATIILLVFGINGNPKN